MLLCLSPGTDLQRQQQQQQKRKKKRKKERKKADLCLRLYPCVIKYYLISLIPAYLPICLSVCPSAFFSSLSLRAELFVHLSLSPSLSLMFLCLSSCLSLSTSPLLFILSLSLCVSVSLSVSLSVRLSVCLSLLFHSHTEHKISIIYFSYIWSQTLLLRRLNQLRAQIKSVSVAKGDKRVFFSQSCRVSWGNESPVLWRQSSSLEMNVGTRVVTQL